MVGVKESLDRGIPPGEIATKGLYASEPSVSVMDKAR